MKIVYQLFSKNPLKNYGTIGQQLMMQILKYMTFLFSNGEVCACSLAHVSPTADGLSEMSHS